MLQPWAGKKHLVAHTLVLSEHDDTGDMTGIRHMGKPTVHTDEEHGLGQQPHLPVERQGAAQSSQQWRFRQDRL